MEFLEELIIVHKFWETIRKKSDILSMFVSWLLNKIKFQVSCSLNIYETKLIKSLCLSVEAREIKTIWNFSQTFVLINSQPKPVEFIITEKEREREELLLRYYKTAVKLSKVVFPVLFYQQV